MSGVDDRALAMKELANKIKSFAEGFVVGVAHLSTGRQGLLGTFDDFWISFGDNRNTLFVAIKELTDWSELAQVQVAP